MPQVLGILYSGMDMGQDGSERLVAEQLLNGAKGRAALYQLRSIVWRTQRTANFFQTSYKHHKHQQHTALKYI